MNGWRVAKRVAHETLDGEVVILDQAAGTYYSLAGSGPEVWALLEHGGDVDAIAAALAARFTAGEADIAAEVKGLVARLEAETLLERVDLTGLAKPAGTAGIAGIATGAPGTQAAAWVTPTFERFDDLQSLLVLDPIHDVDERGWPRQETGSESS